jgi:hypothetical protein
VKRLVAFLNSSEINWSPNQIHTIAPGIYRCFFFGYSTRATVLDLMGVLMLQEGHSRLVVLCMSCKDAISLRGISILRENHGYSIPFS